MLILNLLELVLLCMMDLIQDDDDDDSDNRHGRDDTDMTIRHLDGLFTAAKKDSVVTPATACPADHLIIISTPCGSFGSVVAFVLSSFLPSYTDLQMIMILSLHCS